MFLQGLTEGTAGIWGVLKAQGAISSGDIIITIMLPFKP
jgi:hypothetical protein